MMRPVQEHYLCSLAYNNEAKHRSKLNDGTHPVPYGTVNKMYRGRSVFSSYMWQADQATPNQSRLLKVVE